MSTGDPLFGSGVRAAHGWARHDGARLRLGFWALLAEMPGLVATTARLSWQADRAALLTVATAQLVIGATTAFGLLATNQVLLELLAAGATSDRVAAALPALVPVGMATAAAAALRVVVDAAQGRLAPRVDRIAITSLLERAAETELAVIESADFQNLLSAARRGALAARLLTDNTIALANAAVGLLAAAGVLGVLHPILLPLLVLIVLPRSWSAVRAARARYLSMKAWIENTRQLELLADLLTGRPAADEIRAHQAGPFLLRHYHRLSGASEVEQARLAREAAGVDLRAASVGGLASVITYVALGALLTVDAIPLAVAGTAVLAIRVGTTNLNRLVTQVSGLYEQGLLVADWQRACREAERYALPRGGRGLAGPPVCIAAHDVRFSYPGGDALALDGVSVTIHRGEVVALVGDNGSGKTTLAKLLTGLYLPSAGVVTWDGVPLGELDRRAALDYVALVPQDLVEWPFTASANVTIGRAEGERDATGMARSRASAARAGGADTVVARLARGWDTLLAPEFWGGTSLSGGEWQRLALSRAWYRDTPVMVCDEPTAALDPRAEADAFNRVTRLAGAGRTVLLITHRLASVRRADRIYVLAKGRVVEHGTHDELVAAGGHYAAAYQLQASSYQEPAVGVVPRPPGPDARRARVRPRC